MMFYFAEGRSLVALFQFPKFRTRQRPRRPFFSCWRPMVAATFIFRRGGHWPPVFSFQNFVRDGALDVPFIAIFPFFTFQHVKACRYGLPYLLICCTCVSCVISCFLSVTAAETRICLCSYLRYTAFNFGTSDFFTACVNRIRFTCFKFIR